MGKHRDAWGALLLIGCVFAFFSLWICEFCCLIALHIFDAFSIELHDPQCDAIVFTIYYVVNGLFSGIVGALSGFDMKKRFIAPTLIVICLLPTLVVFVYYTTAIEWACLATTFVIGNGAMIISALKTKKKQEIIQNNLQKV